MKVNLFVRMAVGTLLALTALTGSLPHRAAAATPPIGTLLIVAGTGQKGSTGDGGPATQARLSYPLAPAFDAASSLFFAEFDTHRVRKVTPDGIITTQYQFSEVEWIAFDQVGNLFYAGLYARRVWKVTPEGVTTTVQSNARPGGLAVDGAGNLFISEPDNHRVRKMTPDGIITTVAGNGKPGFSGDGGPATDARLEPFDLTVDGSGALFIADNNRVRRVSLDGIITTVAGNGKPGFSGDGGLATETPVDGPSGLAVDSAGNLFLSDTNDYRVRKVTLDGVISTVAGTGTPGPPEGGVPGASTRLRGPQGLAVDAAGNLFIADTALWDQHTGRGRGPASEHVLEVVGVAAPGLIAGKPFPKP